MEQKWREAAVRFGVRRAAREAAIAKEPVTPEGYAAMAKLADDRRKRDEQINALTKELEAFMSSSEGAAAMLLLEASGQQIALSASGDGYGERLCSFCLDGFQRAYINLWTDKERHGPLPVQDVAREIVMNGGDPQQFLPWLRSELNKIAELV